MITQSDNDAADQITLLKQVMLPGGVPSTATVAIKNGWLPESTGWHVNSIGRVQGDGRDWATATHAAADDDDDDDRVRRGATASRRSGLWGLLPITRE